MSRARGRRPKRRYRTDPELAHLERAFSEVWAQRTWDLARHQTPLGLCFRSAEEWRAWLHRVHEHYGDPELLTLSSVVPVVLVFFQRPGGEWLDALTIDQLVVLAQSGRDREARGLPSGERGCRATPRRAARRAG